MEEVKYSGKKKAFNDSYLKKMGVDAHEVKAEWGCKPLSHYDLYSGETVTIESKDHRTVIDTGMSKKEFFATYGNVEYERERWDE